MDCLIISGLSGAGKSVTVDVLEDIGYYCIDNMPVKLIPQFAELFGSSAEKNKKVAFVVDIRGGRDHSYLFRALEDMERAGSRCRKSSPTIVRASLPKPSTIGVPKKASATAASPSPPCRSK